MSRTQAADQTPDLVIRRDRASDWTMGLLLAVAAVAWASVLGLAPRLDETMAGAGSADAVTFVAGWGIMMAAMMLPSAVPMIGAYATIQRRSVGRAGRGIHPLPFALVYLAVWLAFGVPVYAAQSLLSLVAQTYAGLRPLLPYAVALVLLLAGAYQLSPWKAACLRVCRSPLQFLIARWREGYRGTLGLALEHAAYCVGCCWLLMAILVAGGAMGLHWVLLIAAVVAIEKLLPSGELVARITGAALVLAGTLVALQPELAFFMRGRGM